MKVVVTFGCPRSGTTFMEYLFAGGSYLPIKLTEGNLLHPCKSDNGLYMIKVLFHKHKVLFIRSIRNPYEIYNSFRAARQDHYSNDGVGRNSDERIFKFIHNESNNVLAQKHWFEKHKVEYDLIEVKYESLSTPAGQTEFLSKVGKFITNPTDKLMLSRKIKTFGVKPVREGRLQHGEVGQGFLSLPEKVDIYNNLEDVFKLEGYKP